MVWNQQLVSGTFQIFLLFFSFLTLFLYPRRSIAWRVIPYSQCILSQVNFKTLVSLDSLGGKHSASGGENLWISGLHEVAGKQSGFIPIREYWIIYWRPSFLAVVWFDSSPNPLPPPPVSSTRCLSFSVFLCVAGRVNLRERGGRGWARSQIIRTRKRLPFYKLFNTLWFLQWAKKLLLVLDDKEFAMKLCKEKVPFDIRVKWSFCIQKRF